MAGERVTVKVESNIGEEGPLSVADALHQFLDAFELLSAAIADENGGETVRWRLVSLSKNSPATATGEAYSVDPSIAVAPLVFRGKQRFSEGMTALAEGVVVPWVAAQTGLAKTLLLRNLNGIGRTVFDLDGDAPQAVLVEKSARQGLASIERFEAAQEAESVDRSRSERGTIDANVAEAKTYHGQPALYVRERLSGKIIPCVLTQSAALAAGPTHSWQDAWSGKRVKVKGEIFYDRKGAISRVSAHSVLDVNPQPVDLIALRRLDLLAGRSPTEHLNALWGHVDD